MPKGTGLSASGGGSFCTQARQHGTFRAQAEQYDTFCTQAKSHVLLVLTGPRMLSQAKRYDFVRPVTI